MLGCGDMVTKIHWTEETLNFVTGCTPISDGCSRCFARTMTRRLQAMGQKKYQAGFNRVVCHSEEELFTQPKRWKKPKSIFINSMSDTFHRDVPFEFIDKIYKAMFEAPQHIYQLLTKRPEQMLEYLKGAPFDIPPNIWHGVTVEHPAELWRIDWLKNCRCAGKFVSFEPLLDLIAGDDLLGVDWVIVGGESGPGARIMSPVWAESVVYDARRHGCKVFVKQFGTVWAKENDSKTRKGDDPSEWPEWARRRELPWL